jgi:hypothetical protein
VPVLAASLAASLTAYAGGRAPGTLSVEGGKGAVTIRGNGGLLGRVGRGSVDIVDLSPTDDWRVAVNGVSRSRRVTGHGVNVTFRVLGGDYRLIAKGDGISISAHGSGVATLLGVPGLTGDTGLFAVGPNADCQDSPDQCSVLPTGLTRISFGQSETPSGASP